MANFVDEHYRKFFDIDPEYYPQVNEAIINQKPDLWKSFYPHKTFVKLIKDTINVLDRVHKQSIWVDGAYGTGKSHAVLTLKKMLDASKEEIDDYFAKYQGSLSEDLHQNFLRIKGKKIITVHRYGSATIRNDRQLVFAMQDSIIKALEEHGIKNAGVGSLKDATLAWLQDDVNKAYFNNLILNKYRNEFAGADADEIIENLKSYTGEPLTTLMTQITELADKQRITAFDMNTTALANWIKAIIKENSLDAIVFIWDEFTNYFENNMRGLTGFQEIVDISGSDPFYMIIVTHKVNSLFEATSSDSKRILDRFVDPICNITLPEYMAFELMAEAMKITDDVNLKNEWEDDKQEFIESTVKSREAVVKAVKMDDTVLKKIIPIHPYAALVLKHIATAFNSNQRSMFDFIKNDRGDEIRGFQWFIDNYGPLSDQPLLTIDLLWDFFYEKGKEHLAPKVRNVLDCYDRMSNYSMDDQEKRVFKTILMLQAISDSVGGEYELFVPNNENLEHAFEGSHAFNGLAGNIAQNLINSKVIYQKPLGKGKWQYAVMVNNMDDDQLENKKKELAARSFRVVIEEARFEDSFSFTKSLKLRCKPYYTSTASWSTEKGKWIQKSEDKSNQLAIVFCFAKDDADANKVQDNIIAEVKQKRNVVYVDASTMPLNKKMYDEYIDYSARAAVQRSNDKKLAEQYERYANEKLKEWTQSIKNNSFKVYCNEYQNGELVATYADLEKKLLDIVVTRYACCLESNTKAALLNDTMWIGSSLGQGAQCGAKADLAGAFKGSKLEDYLGDAWSTEKYWDVNPHTLISKIKIAVEKVIKDGFNSNDRVSLDAIYDVLSNPPFGFVPCNLTAFIMGFVLKEYADPQYLQSDNVNNAPMSVDVLKNMIADKLKTVTTPNSRYKTQYIVTMTETLRAFNALTASVYRINPSYCSSLEKTKEQIRNKMKLFPFPTWTIDFIIDTNKLKTDEGIVRKVLQNYCGIVNNGNLGGVSEADLANEIGKYSIDNVDLANDLLDLIDAEHCKAGMQAYVKAYKNGELLDLANSINDMGQYLAILQKKFDAEESKWVWNKAEADKKIDEIILDYKIVKATNEIFAIHENSLAAALKEWGNKCNNLHVSFEYAKTKFGSFGPLIEMIYKNLKNMGLKEADKGKFLENINIYGNDFVEYYNKGQFTFFKDVCAIALGDLPDDAAAEIHRNLGNCFIKDKNIYIKLVQDAVEKYKKDSLITCIRQLWKTKTNTDTPKIWSETYVMPVECFVQEKDLLVARRAFSIINNGSNNESEIKEALAYVDKIDYFDKMMDKKSRDDAFISAIYKDYSAVLTDIQKVKDSLRATVKDSPYNWLSNPTVGKRVKELVTNEYLQGGSDKAIAVIDNMDVVKLKAYLKQLIINNVDVGLAIINEEK